MTDVVVVNDKDEVIGTMPKDEAHRNGTPHRIAVVYLENKEGKILIQVRMSGSLDHSSAGHVDPGESYLEAAKRELREELGVENVELTEIGKGKSDEVYSSDGGHRVHAFQIYKCKADPVKLQEDEVQDVYWADPKAIFKEMSEDQSLKYCGGFRESLKFI
ncbi:NUDIX domain-containing protein [Candidatus Parcubacteria bacterium]|nr:NUDIX domain-containing protein [Candidatus Parcubacteria bacterium]